ncbi:hypothetical protein BHE74_00015020 [Ensete ventricosum]|nr:hypothetical protein BHE74_00015020 [Ensete ventricosum]
MEELNVVHGSDSPENGHREIGKLCNTFILTKISNPNHTVYYVQKFTLVTASNPCITCSTDLWFKEGELCQWIPAQAPWLRE